MNTFLDRSRKNLLTQNQNRHENVYQPALSGGDFLACLCPLQAASKEPDACCAERQGTQLPATPEKGCPSGCGHCSQEIQNTQDLPQPPLSVSAPMPLATPPTVSFTEVFFPTQVTNAALPISGPAPPGRTPTYLLHCAILC